MMVPPSKEEQYSGSLWEAHNCLLNCVTHFKQHLGRERPCKAKPDTVSKTRRWSLKIGRQAFPGNCLCLPWLKWILQNRLFLLILSSWTWRSGVWSPSEDRRLLSQNTPQSKALSGLWVKRSVSRSLKSDTIVVFVLQGQGDKNILECPPWAGEVSQWFRHVLFFQGTRVQLPTWVASVACSCSSMAPSTSGFLGHVHTHPNVPPPIGIHG